MFSNFHFYLNQGISLCWGELKLHGIFVEYVLYGNRSNFEEIIPKIANIIANLENNDILVRTTFKGQITREQ